MVAGLKRPAGKVGECRMLAKGDAAEIFIYGIIGTDWFGDGVSAKQFKDDLRGLGAVKTIDLHINSDGGSVFEAQTMYSLLVDHKATVTAHVDGLAASAASFLAMAADDIVIAEGGFIMIHAAWSGIAGNAAALRKEADLLDAVTGAITNIYVARTGATEAAVKQWMDAETWFSGAEAVANGFADRMVANKRVAAAVSDPTKFRNLPAALRPRRAAALRLISA